MSACGGLRLRILKHISIAEFRHRGPGLRDSFFGRESAVDAWTAHMRFEVLDFGLFRAREVAFEREAHRIGLIVRQNAE